MISTGTRSLQVVLGPRETGVLHDETNAALAKRSLSGVIAYLVLLAIFFATTSAFDDHPTAAVVEIAWMLVVSAARLAILRWFETGYPQAPQRWVWAFRIATLCAGLSWGLGCALWMRAIGHGTATTLMLVSTAGVAAGATSSLGPSRRLANAYLASILMPTIVSLTIAGDGARVTYGFAALLVLYLSFLVLEVRRAHQAFVFAVGKNFALVQRAEELAERTRRMKQILDTVGQGFLSVDLDGNIAGERSAILEQWIGPCEGAEPIWEYIGRHSPDAAVWLELGLSSLKLGVMPADCVIAQLPRELRAGDRYLEIEYRPTYAGESVTQLLVIVSDVTSEIERRRSEQERRDLLGVVERIMTDRRGVAEFVNEANRLALDISSNLTASDAEILRWIHTLKGNCSIFGLEGIARACHDVESSVEATGDPPTLSARLALYREWELSAERIKLLLGDEHAIQISRSEYVALVASVERGVSGDALVEELKRWELEPSERRLERIAEQARRLAHRLGKDNIEVVIEPNGVRLPHGGLGGFWSAFVHLVRNAVDHGLESSDERTAIGKNPIGRLRVGTFFDATELVVCLEDDGRGIDWDRVARAAKARGVAHQSAEDLESALFTDGISTAETVSEVSGRGVGMSAIRSEVQALGGRLELSSQMKRGTMWTARFPRSVAVMQA